MYIGRYYNYIHKLSVPLIGRNDNYLYVCCKCILGINTCTRKKNNNNNNKITIVARRSSRHPLAVPHLSTFLEFIMHILILPGRLVKYPKVNSPYSVCLLSSLHNLQNATPMAILYKHVYI